MIEAVTEKEKIILDEMKITNKKTPKYAKKIIFNYEKQFRYYRIKKVTQAELDSFFALESLIILKGDLQRERQYYSKRKKN